MLSLRTRFVLVAALILAAFSISAGWILRQSFQASIVDRAREQLKLQMFGFIATADYDHDRLELPEQLADPRFNQLNSGLLAVVIHDGEVVWQSRSLLLEQFPLPPSSDTGQWLFQTVEDQNGRQYYQLSINVFWEEAAAASPYTFVVREWDQPYLAQIKSFETTLWIWLGGLVLAAIVLVFAVLNLGFRPFRRLARELDGVEMGRQQRIIKQYPSEIMPVVNNLNRLVEHERAMRERYKHSLGNLAHSLKTPLAVLKGLERGSDPVADSQQDTLDEQVRRMDEIVNYQLKRAITAVPQVSGQGAVLLDMYQRMTKVLAKVYADRAITFEQDIRPGLRMPWDDGDTLEVLGNLMDNACKYGGDRVRVGGHIHGGQIRFYVEDNGPGIAPGDEAKVLSRGVRRDERASGQGIGLAVVNDIVTASGGNLSIAASEWGGARFLISLPLNW
ncbi:MAG: ATP-binding protein [Pseudomonadota bacterium]|nr:ATP-binding protein [Pseudomonadota bacterium]